MGVRSYSDKQLLDRLAKIDGFTHYPKGLFDIYVRSDEDQFDAFDDKGYTYDNTSGEPKFVMVRNVTTNAGSYGLKHFDEYNHLGCAVLKSDQIVYESHAYGLHKGKPGYREVKGFPYYRDNNRNERAEEIGPVYNDIIGANIHRAGVDSTVIKNWSTACIVTGNLNKFLAWLEFMNKRPLTVAILKEF